MKKEIRLEDIIHTFNEIKEKGYEVENEIIKSINIEVLGHFNNCICPSINIENGSILDGYSLTSNVGYLIRAVVELFEITKEDGLRLSDIKNIPCRLIVTPSGRVKGFGHFMKDKFVLTEEFVEINAI